MGLRILALATVIVNLFPGPLFAEEDLIYHPHVLNPPSHHLISTGTIIHADLLVPIDCGLASRGPMVAQTTEPVYNTIQGWENEIILPAGTRLEGFYTCYPRSVYIVFDRFVFSGSPPPSLRCRYTSPHACTHVLEGNTKHHLRVPYGFQVLLMTDHALWIPDK